MIPEPKQDKVAQKRRDSSSILAANRVASANASLQAAANRPGQEPSKAGLLNAIARRQRHAAIVVKSGSGGGSSKLSDQAGKTEGKAKSENWIEGSLSSDEGQKLHPWPLPSE